MSWVSALASFVMPGFGQGQGGKRVRMAIFAALGLASDLALWWTVWALVGSLGVRLVAALDGGIAARRRAVSADRAEWLAGIAGAVGIAGLLAIYLGTQQFDCPSSSMYPTLQIGDHFLVDRASTLWRPLHRADVIVFHQPCNPARDYDKRVIALAGDTVEIRCEVVYVNGKPLPHELVDPACTYQDHDDMRDAWFETKCARYRETLDGVTFDVYGRRPDDTPDRTKDFPHFDEMPIAPTCAGGHDPDYVANAGGVHQHAGTIVDDDAPTPGDPCLPREHFVVPEDSVFVLGDNRPNSNDSRYWGVVPVELVVGRVIGIVRSSGVLGTRARFGDVR